MNSFRLADTNAESTLLTYFAVQAAKASKDSLFVDIEDMIDHDGRKNVDVEMVVCCNESQENDFTIYKPQIFMLTWSVCCVGVKTG